MKVNLFKFEISEEHRVSKRAPKMAFVGSRRTETIWISESIKKIRRDREKSEQRQIYSKSQSSKEIALARSEDETQYSLVHRRSFKVQSL
jgi:hypothetical protein